MAVFTSNQVNHVYVAKDIPGGSGTVGYALSSGAAVKPSLSNNGDLFCWKTADNELYFTYKNAMGGTERSDLIPIKNIMWAKVISGNHRSQKRELKKYKITVPASLYATNASSENVNAGSTICVTLEVKLNAGIETTYRKQAFALIDKSSSKSSITKALYESLKANFDRDDYVKDLFTISADITSGTPDTYNFITILEKSKSATYETGLRANDPIEFTVFSDEIPTMSGGIETISSSSYVENSYDIADLEYFALGERADVYRNVGWPNANPSKTMITASEIGDSKHFNLLQIHYAFTDSNEGVQKSEKDITIVIPESSTTVTKISRLLSQIAYQVLGDDNSGISGAATGGNAAFTGSGKFVNAKVGILDIPNGGIKVLD